MKSWMYEGSSKTKEVNSVTKSITPWVIFTVILISLLYFNKSVTKRSEYGIQIIQPRIYVSEPSDHDNVAQRHVSESVDQLTFHNERMIHPNSMRKVNVSSKVNNCLDSSLQNVEEPSSKDVDPLAKKRLEKKFKVVMSVSGSHYKEMLTQNKIPNVPFQVYRLSSVPMEIIPRSFEKSYKNPCWHTSSSKLFCLPYFYLIGMPKSGSTDFYNKVMSHPHVIRGRWKEPGFWTKMYYQNVKNKLNVYMKHFSALITKLEKNKSAASLFITGDGTQASMWGLFDYQFLGLKGKGYGLPDILHAVQPDAKLMVILRDPIERLFSAYHYFGTFKRSSLDFHEKVLSALKSFYRCKKKAGNDLACIDTQSSLKTEKRLRIGLGLYSVLLRSWLRVFPREQMKIVRLEEWQIHCESVLPEVWQFLQIDLQSNKRIKEICTTKYRQTKATKVPMLNKTRKLLECFYQPYNEDLAELLQDKGYLWN